MSAAESDFASLVVYYILTVLVYYVKCQFLKKIPKSVDLLSSLKSLNTQVWEGMNPK